ncbi:hypothetical protein ACWEQU_09890 [Streptomyces nodosus]
MTARSPSGDQVTGPPGRAARTGAAGGRTPRRRRRAWLLLTAILLVALIGTAEGVARALIGGRISDRLRATVGDTRVHLGGSALVGLARGRLGLVTVTGDQARLGRLTGASVDLRLSDVTLSGSPRVGHIRGRITVPADALAVALQSSAGSLPVSGVVTDPSSGTLVIALGQGGPGSITVRPSLRDGRVAYSLEDARILGRPAPERLTRMIEETLSKQNSRRQDPSPLGVSSLDVTSAGVVATVRADDVAFGGKDR